MQTEICLKNLKMYHEAIGDRIVAIAVSGTDLGAQRGPLISPETYREFFKPYHRRINNWIHRNTKWKVFFHSCGSIRAFIKDFIEIGVDILNPVQFTATNMDLASLKREYGGRIVFWGGNMYKLFDKGESLG